MGKVKNGVDAFSVVKCLIEGVSFHFHKGQPLQCRAQRIEMMPGFVGGGVLWCGFLRFKLQDAVLDEALRVRPM